jgi:hypothetical protein
VKANTTALILLAAAVAGGTASGGAPFEIVLVEPQAVQADAVARWKQEGFTGVAMVLKEEPNDEEYRRGASVIAAASVDIYYWIEVGRNVPLAAAHPRWMASLGTHEDWQKRFPGARLPATNEVAKAFPWVPIWYRENFDAHLSRIEKLLRKVPASYRGLLVNDLQGAPSSCGCGNLQCRWATDYHVSSTATRVAGDDAAARFVSAVRERAGAKQVVPVWVTECEEEDLPANRRPDGRSTGLCGTVGCAVGLCPKDFTKQWSGLLASHDGPIGLLGLHREFGRDTAQGPGPAWVKSTLRYVDQVPAKNGGKPVPHERLWLVVQGYDTAEEPAARKLAAEQGVAAVVVARTRIDQSYEPRIIPATE